MEYSVSQSNESAAVCQLTNTQASQCSKAFKAQSSHSRELSARALPHTPDHYGFTLKKAKKTTPATGDMNALKHSHLVNFFGCIVGLKTVYVLARDGNKSLNVCFNFRRNVRRNMPSVDGRCNLIHK